MVGWLAGAFVACPKVQAYVRFLEIIEYGLHLICCVQIIKVGIERNLHQRSLGLSTCTYRRKVFWRLNGFPLFHQSLEVVVSAAQHDELISLVWVSRRVTGSMHVCLTINAHSPCTKGTRALIVAAGFHLWLSPSCHYRIETGRFVGCIRLLFAPS